MTTATQAAAAAAAAAVTSAADAKKEEEADYVILRSGEAAAAREAEQLSKLSSRLGVSKLFEDRFEQAHVRVMTSTVRMDFVRYL